MLEAALLPSTALRTTLLKPVVAALFARLHQRRRCRMRRSAEQAMREAIRELLLFQPDERRVESRLAQARTSGVPASDIRLAETMLARHRETHARTRGMIHRSRRWNRHLSDAPPEVADSRY